MSHIPRELKVSIPEDRTAQYPADRRDNSRLLVIDRTHDSVIDAGSFRNIVEYIAGDLIVVNDTFVIPARVEGRKPGGGKVEVLFLTVDKTHTYSTSGKVCDKESTPPYSPPAIAGGECKYFPFAIAGGECDKESTPPYSPPAIAGGECKVDSPAIAGGECVEVEALVSPGRRLRPGLVISLPRNAQFILGEKDDIGRWRGLWSCASNKKTFSSWLEDAGMPPLPPYIHRKVEPMDRKRYQTTYARIPGSLAAPTAGFHFTTELLADMKTAGCDIATLTLDVGLGTFLPIRNENLSEHKMQHERYNIPPETAQTVNSAMNSNRNITVVGTTVVRTLEDAATEGLPLKSGERTADLFIYPPYSFKVVDRLLTNFHRPDSTLIQLVAAMIGWDLVNQAYRTALDNGFRFYSYGDAMLII